MISVVMMRWLLSLLTSVSESFRIHLGKWRFQKWVKFLFTYWLWWGFPLSMICGQKLHHESYFGFMKAGNRQISRNIQQQWIHITESATVLSMHVSEVEDLCFIFNLMSNDTSNVQITNMFFLELWKHKQLLSSGSTSSFWKSKSIVQCL